MLRGQIEYFNDDTACILAHTNYEEVVKGFGAEGIIFTKKKKFLIFIF